MGMNFDYRRYTYALCDRASEEGDFEEVTLQDQVVETLEKAIERDIKHLVLDIRESDVSAVMSWVQAYLDLILIQVDQCAEQLLPILTVLSREPVPKQFDQPGYQDELAWIELGTGEGSAISIAMDRFPTVEEIVRTKIEQDHRRGTPPPYCPAPNSRVCQVGPRGTFCTAR